MGGGLVTQVHFVVLGVLMGRSGLVWSGSVHGETNLVVHGEVFWVFRSWCCGVVALFWLSFCLFLIWLLRLVWLLWGGLAALDARVALAALAALGAQVAQSALVAQAGLESLWLV